MKKQLFAMGLLLFFPAFAFAESPVRKAEVIEITMPDGRQQQGVLLDGKFVPLAKTDEDKPSTPTTEVPVQASVEKNIKPQVQILYAVQPTGSEIVNKKFTGYKVTVENAGTNTVKIVTAEILNGNNGQMGYQRSKANTTGRAIGWGLAFGLIGAGVSASHNARLNKEAQAQLAAYQNV